ncbi:hypothetical protein LB523_12140 [Mesorhizobium sp. ESP-6-4]|uniref:hypothetical protein n=1 Tax=Mesorhizobium sp. ESP-6-4 TaxID=2876624 RepID=UPI001CCABD8E|nr:hypothetical protein [Mesorhizobium sp. ESP-6-4]MBZ9659796.1 hypothetical protein [Mesorhizobium sp. ESP-6-4]
MAIAKSKTGKRTTVSPGTKGAISEHLATAWLLSNGYDVFRNVSPNGRADLLAVDWVKDETIRVDVKSEGFSLDADKTGAMAAQARRRADSNSGYDIKYLVVKNDGDCEWYGENAINADNDNSPDMWTDKVTGKSFWSPGHDMSSKEWTYFCHWLLRAYPEKIKPHSEVFVRNISSRGVANDNPRITKAELPHLERLRVHIHKQLQEAGRLKKKADAA